MDEKILQLVRALHQDLVDSYPTLTLKWLEEEAEKQLNGARPTGGPGIFLNDYLKKAGFIA
jgi:hypothetical protein